MKKILKVFYSIMLALTMAFSQLTSINAWDNSIPHEFTRVKEIDYPEWWSRKVGVKKWSTVMCTYNGNIAYCLEASKNTPVNGQYVASVINNNSAVRKLLYYGYGGPGYDDSIKAIYTQQLFACVPDDFGESYGNFNDGAYLFTHIWLSYAYSNDLMGLSLADFNKKWPNPGNDGTGYGDNIMWGMKVITAMPEPSDAMFEVNGQCHVTANLNATLDKENMVQKTETVTLKAGNNATANITLQDNVTLHNITTGTQKTGGIAVVKGEESFYLTAPLKNAPKDYKSGNIAGNNCESFTALAILPGGNSQAEGAWTTDPAALGYSVNWLELGSLRISKVDNTSSFQKGSKFRLVSTSYDGYDEIFEVIQDEDGNYELVVEGLPIGTYALTEIDCEDYFAPTVAQFEVTIEKDKTTKQVVVNTLRPTGTLNVTKTLETATSGAINKADHDMTKTSYKIIAADDIKDTVSLKDLYSKDEAITVGSGKCVIDVSKEQLEYSSGVKLIKGTDNGDGTFSVDENGELELAGIPLGKYQVVETLCPDGYVLDKTAKDIQFTQEDYTTTIYNQSVKQTNKITKVKFSKKSVTGEDELEGAKLKLTDETGNTVDEWTSAKTAHEIDGLKAGKKYILTEMIVPNGYVKAKSIEFTVQNNGTVQKVEMIDKVVTVSKQDVAGNEIEGALLQVLDKESNIVDEWTSTNKVHYINGLEEGKTYILHEDLSPNGYNISNDVEFTVTKEKVNQNIKMIDTITEVSKVDENNELLKNAKLEVVSVKTKNIIDRWTTGQHIMDIDEDMKTKLKANDIIEGTYVKDGMEVSYKITANEKDYILMFKLDDETSYYKIDIDGNETTHMIQGLVSGQEYILREREAPKGYATAKEQTFIASKDKDVILTMTDEITKIEISKQDITTQKELEGAKLEVKDNDGNVIDSWTSGKKSHFIQGLEVGKTYTLTETSAPKGYKISQSIDFTIKDTGDVQKIIMYDEAENIVVTGDQNYMLGYLFSLLSLSIFILGRIYFLSRKKD